MSLDPDNLFIEESIPEGLFDSVLPLITPNSNTEIYNIRSLYNFNGYLTVGIQVFQSLMDKISNKNKPCDFFLNIPD